MQQWRTVLVDFMGGSASDRYRKDQRMLVMMVMMRIMGMLSNMVATRLSWSCRSQQHRDPGTSRHLDFLLGDFTHFRCGEGVEVLGLG